ncbi:MAG: DNA translocase FtsK [Clostridia bacterium]|nr:DNA translocase FtsK [Clostridia bacterium]
MANTKNQPKKTNNKSTKGGSRSAGSGVKGQGGGSARSSNRSPARGATRGTSKKQTPQNTKKSGGGDSSVTVKTRSANKREITAILLITFCIFMVVCMFNKAGVVGRIVTNVFYGFFGLFGTIFLLIYIVSFSVAILRGTYMSTFTGKVNALVAAFSLTVTALLHSVSNVYTVYMSTHEKIEFFSMLSSLWSSTSVSPFGGGLFAGAVSTVLLHYVSRVGALVILIPLTLIFTMLLFKFSLLPFFTKLWELMSRTGKQVAAGVKRVRAARDDEDETDRPIKVIPGGNTAADTGGEDDVPPLDMGTDSDSPFDDQEDGKHYTDDFFTKKVELENIIFDDEDGDFDNNGFGHVSLVGIDDESKAPGIPDYGETLSKVQRDMMSFDSSTETEDFDPGIFSYTNTDAVQKAMDGDSQGGDSRGGESSDGYGRPGHGDGIPAGEGFARDGFTRDGSGASAGSSDGAEQNPDKSAESSAQHSMETPVLSTGEFSNYKYPPLELLCYDSEAKSRAVRANMTICEETKKKLIDTLKNFNVDATCTNYYIGPSVTRYEIVPAVGIRMETIKRLSDEIAFFLAADKVRIEAPIPGKSAVGIEVPNRIRSTVYLREILSSDAFRRSRSKLTAAVGKDINGDSIVMDVDKLPHLLIGGTTGSGKSVTTNGIITSILYKSTPDEVRFILIDPKIVEFKKYDGIPHLLLPVVTDAKKAASALAWAVSEMDKRYNYFAKYNTEDIDSYNALAVTKPGLRTMPRIVIVIDELADLMTVAKASVETAINRIAQKARACGMHLIVATQRPSADVVTGLIKSNIPSRICLRVKDNINSRIILDMSGGENLLDKGDLIFAPVYDGRKLTRVQSGFIDGKSINEVAGFIKTHSAKGSYDDGALALVDAEDPENDKPGDPKGQGGEKEDLYGKVVDFAMEKGEISTSLIQRAFNLGYNRAADIMDRLVEEGIVERATGSKRSKVIRK